MPSSEQILDSLTRAAEEWRAVAIAWHAALLIALTFVAVGVRPSRRIVVGALALPLASVSLIASRTGNVFNAVVMLALAAGVASIAVSLPASPPVAGRRWSVAIGAMLIAFGAVYPHFVAPDPISLLIASPLGVVPCPTLSVVIGAALALRGFESRALTWLLTGAGVFYGFVGVVRLGVQIDVVLLAASIVLPFARSHVRHPHAPASA